MPQIWVGRNCLVIGWVGENDVMELSYPSDAEAFRQEIRTWLETNLPKGWGTPGFEMSAEDRKAFNDTWPSK